MFKTLRTRLLIGLTPLLAILIGLGFRAIIMVSRLGNNIDVILKENYRSDLAAHGGQVDVTSCLSAGTAFYLTLPTTSPHETGASDRGEGVSDHKKT